MGSSGPVDIVRRARALVFDFDGTLVDSAAIKRRAFDVCFEGCDRREEILAYCHSHHHIPRGEKFRYVYETILKRPYAADLEALLHARFEAETTQQIIEANPIPGGEPFMRSVRRSHCTALLSSTPHAILLHILEQRRWRAYFDVVQGAPVDKAGWLRAFLEERRLNGEDVVFFGDTPEDAHAARSATCPFVAVANPALAQNVTFSITDFTELLRP